MTTWAKVMHNAFHKKRPAIKKIVHVPALWKRDKRGRFVRLLRKAYTRRLLDRTRLVTGMELMAENVTMNNALLQRLKERASA